MTAGTWDLNIEAGADFGETYTSANDNGSAYDWTGWTPRAQIRTQAGPSGGLLLDLTPYLTVNVADVVLSIPASVTVGLGRNGRWDLEMVNGTAVIRLLQGKASISPEVTQ